MSKIIVNGNRLIFMCPACKSTHEINYGLATRPNWEWNNDTEFPTITPSILCTSGHYTNRFKPGDECWCTYREKHPENPPSFKCERCHSFITNGKIRFQGDCSHDLANTEVELPDYEDEGPINDLHNSNI